MAHRNRGKARKAPYAAGVVGCLVNCMGCPWNSQSYKNGLAIAARHAQATGHTVVAEQTIVVTYNPRRGE